MTNTTYMLRNTYQHRCIDCGGVHEFFSDGCNIISFYWSDCIGSCHSVAVGNSSEVDIRYGTRGNIDMGTDISVPGLYPDDRAAAVYDLGFFSDVE